MNTPTRLLFSIVLIACCSLAANAQRQTALYIDDGHGAFSILTAPLGGGAITLPGASITFPPTNAAGVLTNTGSGSLSWTAVSGFTPSYFNVYSTLLPFPLFPGEEVPILEFGTLGVNAGFTNDGIGAFTVTATGVYNVEFSVSIEVPSAFAIAVNGVIAPNSQFGCATGTTVVHGNAMLSLTSGDVITLVNAGLGFALLSSPYPGTVEASLTATRIQ